MPIEVLQLDVAGHPQAWITPQEAATRYAAGDVAWTIGERIHVMRGGVQRATGELSRIGLHPIIAVHGTMPDRARRHVPRLTNAKLFARDRNVCAYCAGIFPPGLLTREHIQPVSRGGLDTWMNCITACRACNVRKGNRLPQEARLALAYLPYVPNLHEDMILAGRRIVADQMAFLLACVPAHSRLRS